MDHLLLYLATGVVSGILAGLLGIGGGLIIVPALVFLLGDTAEHVMHMAVGTSLAVVIPTAVASTRAHHKKGTVHWHYWKILTPGLFSGTLIGAFIADQLPGHTLRNIFAVFELLVALQLALGLKAKATARDLGILPIFCITFLIGIVCAFAGVGGGIMVVPLLSWLRLPIKSAISTSAACGMPIATAGTIGFILIGLGEESSLPDLSTGFIYWPAFLFISLSSILFAPLGAKLAHALPADILRRIFAIFLLLLAILMFMD